MSLNQNNIKMVAVGITSIDSEWWLSHVNSSYMVNRIYYFFNAGVECDIIVDNIKNHIKLTPGKLYFIPSNLPIKFYLDNSIKVNHIWFDFVASDICFKENLFEMNVAPGSCEKSLMDFLVRYFVERNNETFVFYKPPSSDKMRIPYDVIQSTASLILMLINEQQNIVSNIPTGLSKVIDYIQTNYNENITLDKLCKIAHLSKSQLIRQFKNVFRIAPHQYILNFRMYLSASMLNDGMTVTNVAFAVGFGSVNAFSNSFKKHFGFAPSELKKE